MTEGETSWRSPAQLSGNPWWTLHRAAIWRSVRPQPNANHMSFQWMFSTFQLCCPILLVMSSTATRAKIGQAYWIDTELIMFIRQLWEAEPPMKSLFKLSKSPQWVLWAQALMLQFRLNLVRYMVMVVSITKRTWKLWAIWTRIPKEAQISLLVGVLSKMETSVPGCKVSLIVPCRSTIRYTI